MQMDRRGVKQRTFFHKIEHPLGSKIFQPKVYLWEPSWYFGGAFKRKHFVAGAGNGARSADFVARGVGAQPSPHAARIETRCYMGTFVEKKGSGYAT